MEDASPTNRAIRGPSRFLNRSPSPTSRGSTSRGQSRGSRSRSGSPTRSPYSSGFLNRSFSNESLPDNNSMGGTDNDENNSIGSMGSMSSSGSLSRSGTRGGRRRKPHKSAENNIPTLSVMIHGSPQTFKKPPTQTLADFLRSVDRLHDPQLENDVHPEEAAGLLMLDLGISIKNSHSHNVLIISSPYQTCLQTAVITCQQFGVSSFYVNYAMGESMIGKLASGWDWGCVPLYLQPYEMDAIVAKQSRKGERKSRNKVYIEGYLGEKQSMETRNETKMNFSNRIQDNLDQIRANLINPRDHVIVISHADVLTEFALKYGKIEVMDVQHNSFMTFCIPSDSTAWLLGRSRVQVVPK